MDVVVSLAEEEAENAAVASATTAACGSSFCSSAAAVWVADADAAALTADANLISKKGTEYGTPFPFYLFSKTENLVNTLQQIHGRQILP